MNERAYCGACGAEIKPDDKFCNHCGADQEPFKAEEATAVMPPESPPADPPPPPPPPQEAPAPRPEPPQPQPPPPPPSPPPGGTTTARENAERVAPGVNDLFEELGSRLRTPGVALAGLSALVGAGICLAAGLILAIVLPNASYLAVGGGSSLVEQTLAQAVSFSQANMSVQPEEFVLRTVPVLFVLIPILGVAAGVAASAPRTSGMPQRERFLWAVASGVPFAVLMAIFCLSLGEVDFDLLSAPIEFSVGSVLLLSLIWGALGGALGMLFDVRRAGGSVPNPLPPSAGRFAGIGWSALRPLLLALLVVGVLGTAAWVVQVAREDSFRDFPPRSTGVAVGEQIVYAGDHAIAILPLGAGASERLSGTAALPIDDYSDLPDDLSASSPSDYNLFDFSDTMPAFLFALTLVVLIGITALLALYAGFAVARRVGEKRPDRAAAWGALVGPVWSIAMVLLAALARKDIVGNPSGDSVFIAFLVGGAVLGALGGFLAAQGATAAAAPHQAPPPPTSGT
ncbi:MAG TPA: zinc ribbon domain-containing protein [Solirubrobacterales bacterium]|nr:zinc ribbon domain-containing protein [Solirubrobacterales bacterium]